MKNINSLLAKNTNQESTFKNDFNNIIISQVNDYDNFNGELKASLRLFLDDIIKNGCVSGIITDFIYNSDCKNFYIKHIDDLENFVQDYQESTGTILQINTPRYTFVVWLCFEEYCYNLRNLVFGE